MSKRPENQKPGFSKEAGLFFDHLHRKRREPGRRAWLSQKEEKKITLVAHKDTPLRSLSLYAEPASA
jgi:hypothetical protein